MAKKEYKNYPDNYFNIIEKFRTDGEDIIIEDTFGALSYARHDLHRFFKALSIAAHAGDGFATDLCNITRDMVLILEPPHAKRTDMAKLIVKVNPLTRAVLRSNPGAGKAPSREVIRDEAGVEFPSGAGKKS